MFLDYTPEINALPLFMEPFRNPLGNARDHAERGMSSSGETQLKKSHD